MKKIMLLLVVLILVSTVVFARGSSSDTSTGANVVRWSYWGEATRIRAAQLAIDEFTNRTGIIIVPEVAPGTTEHFDKFRIQFAGGNAVDIVQTGGDFSNFGLNDQALRVVPTSSLPTRIEDLLLPLDSYVRDGTLDISKIDAAAVQAGTRDGVLYAIPVATNMPAMIYNKSLLERVGAPLPRVSMTWAEFETWMGQVQARLPAGTYVMTDNSSTQTGSVFFGYWSGDNGTSMWDGTSTHLTAADVQRYYEMWGRWRTAGYVPPANVSADYAETNESTSAIIAGRTVVSQVWSNSITNYQNATRDELELIELPNAAVTRTLWGQMSQMMAINKNSKNALNAVHFLNFYINDASAQRFVGTQYGIPVTSTGRAVITADADSNLIKQMQYLDVAGNHAGPRNPNMPSDSEWNSGLYLISQQVAFGTLTPAAGAQQVMDLINRLTR